MQVDDYPVHQFPLVTNVKRVPLPAELMEQFNRWWLFLLIISY